MKFSHRTTQEVYRDAGRQHQVKNVVRISYEDANNRPDHIFISTVRDIDDLIEHLQEARSELTEFLEPYYVLDAVIVEEIRKS